MSIASIFYNTVGKRTSTLVLTIVGGALVFERGFDSLCKYFGGCGVDGGGGGGKPLCFSRSIKNRNSYYCGVGFRKAESIRIRIRITGFKWDLIFLVIRYGSLKMWCASLLLWSLVLYGVLVYTVRFLSGKKESLEYHRSPHVALWCCQNEYLHYLLTLQKRFRVLES